MGREATKLRAASGGAAGVHVLWLQLARAWFRSIAAGAEVMADMTCGVY